MRLFRRRFAALAERQLALFAEEEAALIVEAEQKLAEYDAASSDEAEARYSEYLDSVEAGCEVLVEIRDSYARTLDDDAAEEYRETFDRAVRRRFPRFGLGLE